MAALSAVLRKSAASAAPLAVRLASSGSIHRPAVFTALSRASTLFLQGPSAPRFFSEVALPKSDQTLLRVLESEIKCAEESDEQPAGEVPSGFPFQIEDLPGQQTVTLKREYQGETIEVIVQMPSLISGDDVEQDHSGSDDNNENGNQSSIPLIVNVSKRNGPSLEFGVTAFPDEIAIESLSVKNPDLSEDQIAYEGPDFSDLDENLQKAFHKYLEIRGIKPSTTNFLHEYMIEKDNREYIRWMKNLKNFVQS